MIFHTAADKNYYDYFYKFYKKSIKNFYPTCELSIHYMGENLLIDSDVRYISYENTNTEKIKEAYKVDEKSALGYYCLSRWLFLPEVDDNIVVSDVDIIAIKKIAHDRFESLFREYQVINITRKKKGGTEGGMAMIAIRSDIIESVKIFARDLLKEKTLHWALDVEVRTFLYENFKTVGIPEMHVLGKRSNFENYDNTDRSFAIRKGNIEAKIHTLTPAIKKQSYEI